MEEKNGWVKKLPFLEIFLVSVVSLVFQACCFPLTAVGTQHSFYTSLGEALGHPFQLHVSIVIDYNSFIYYDVKQ